MNQGGKDSYRHSEVYSRAGVPNFQNLMTDDWYWGYEVWDDQLWGGVDTIIIEIKCTINITHFNHPGFSNTWTVKFQMFKLVLEKAEEPDIKLPTSAGSSKKQESSRKTSTSLLTTPKPLTVWITIKCGKFFKRLTYQTTWPASWETYIQVRMQQLELDMEQQTGSK